LLNFWVNAWLKLSEHMQGMCAYWGVYMKKNNDKLVERLREFIQDV